MKKINLKNILKKTFKNKKKKKKKKKVFKKLKVYKVKKIKNADNEFKIKIVEILWNIIYSNKEEDMYESNLMRRLSGLLYLDNKIVGDIKEKIKAKFAK